MSGSSPLVFEIDAVQFHAFGGASVAGGADFDDVIDVRSPSEFAEDSVPGSINLPVLSDAERAEVGTIYVQTSKFSAKKLGARLISQNIAGHLGAHLRDKPADYRPLVLCWRGGQRSRSMAIVLSEIGWRAGVLSGGYRAYRRDVARRLYETPAPFAVALIDGPTGVGKTEVLRRLAERGAPVVDLEKLAGHKGSVFGSAPSGGQPSQKAFEGALVAALDAARNAAPGRPILMEAESSKIGERIIPPSLWKAMLAAPRVEISAPLAARAEFSAARYGWIAAEPERLAAILDSLAPIVGWETVRRWRSLARVGDLTALAQDLIGAHYDPAYARRETRGSEPAGARPRPPRAAAQARVALTGLTEADLDAAADQVAIWASQLPASNKSVEVPLTA